MAEFDAAIFFDNDQGYLDDVKTKCPGVTLVKVKEVESTIKPSYNKFGVLSQSPLKDLMDELYTEPTEEYYNKPNNGYVQYLLQYKIAPSYHPDSGIKQADIDKYYKWAQITSGNRVLLLDWDLTLSVFDGIEFPRQEEFSMFFGNSYPRHNFLGKMLIKPKDIAIFYLGGQERFLMITEWLKDVANSGVYIAVLTNNGGARDVLFQQVVDTIVPKGSYEIIASMYSPYNGNKGKALMMDPRFAKLCPKTGGKRQRQTKRQCRKSRKHRK